MPLPLGDPRLHSPHTCSPQAEPAFCSIEGGDEAAPPSPASPEPGYVTEEGPQRHRKRSRSDALSGWGATTSRACSSWEPMPSGPASGCEATIGHTEGTLGGQAKEFDYTEGDNGFEGKLNREFGHKHLQDALTPDIPMHADFDGDLEFDDIAAEDCMEPRMNARTQAFDDPEGGGLMDRIDEEAEAGCPQGEAAFDEPPDVPFLASEVHAPTAQDALEGDLRARVIRRRLGFKANPTEAAARGYSVAAPVDLGDNPRLGTRSAAAAAKRKVAELVKAHRGRAAAARDAGWAAVRRAPEHAVDGSQANIDYDTMDNTFVPRAWEAHSSHQPRRAPGTEIVYCATCGVWSTGQRARGLTMPCKGEAGSRGKYLRLLKLGIKPVPGARVPTELKAAKARGTRSRAAGMPRTSRRGARRMS